MQTRILLYPVGTEDEIDFSGSIGTSDVPAVGDTVQTIKNDQGQYERGPKYEVVSREWYSTNYGGDHYVVEVALAVKECAT